MTPELQALKDKTLASMVDYMRNDEEDADHDPEFDPGYTQAEVDRCAEIVDEYPRRWRRSTRPRRRSATPRSSRPSSAWCCSSTASTRTARAA